MGSVNTWSIDYYMYMMLYNMRIELAYGVSNDMVATSYGRMGICLVLGIARLVIFIVDVIDLPAEIKGLSFRKF
ncbi:hypothetical protein ANAPRD1_00247 [Anaplasma phagocytophilum]|nr:hypothetical protein ANAPRD1_00247 [Anaplasma phagocytophilum]